MKKIISLVLMIAMLLPVVAHAEGDIQLIAGLEFGMDINQASAVSKYEIVEEANEWRASFLKDVIGLDNTAYIVGQGTIGGYECCVVGNFDALGRLVQVMYFFDKEAFEFSVESENSTYRETYSQQYKKVETALIAQYAEGAGLEDALNLTVGIPNVYATDTINFYKTATHKFFNHEYAQRLVSQSDETTVVINHVMMEREMTYGSSRSEYAHILVYTYYDFPVGQEEQSYSVGF